MSELLQKILLRCDEYGDCMLWTGPIGNGSPQVFIDGKYKQARRLVFELEKGFAPPQGLSPVMTCRNAACLTHNHMRLMTVAQIAQLASSEGKFRSPQRRAAITKGVRRVAKKLDLDKANAIREAPSAAEAARMFGVHKSMASRIRRGEAWATVTGASVFSNWRP